MKRIIFFSTILIHFGIFSSFAQQVKYPDREIHGSVIDSATHTPLPYANIGVIHYNRGVISNENGSFSLDVSGLSSADTVCFHYIGYRTKSIPLGQLDTSAVISLTQEIYDLSGTLVFGNAPDARSIVKMVLKNREANHPPTTRAGQTFIRYRDITDFETFRLIYKGSTMPGLDEDAFKAWEENRPKYMTSYTDFLGNIYRSKNIKDTEWLKVDPLRIVELREKESDEQTQYKAILKTLFSETGEDEYWKVKTGIIRLKKDTPGQDTVEQKATLNDPKKNLNDFGKSIETDLWYSFLYKLDQWEFFYETDRYEYSLVGGTSVNGEEVYIIDFTPADKGLYFGRLYIAIETYALIRADYKYAQGKTGIDIHLLGLGLTETQFDGSIYFEKKNGIYVLKYFSTKSGTTYTINRSVEISKKKKRALFDKELMDVDFDMDISMNMESSIEYLVLDDKEIPESEFLKFTQPEFMDIIYVDQFDDNLWNGYSIIEPTKKMKEYRKQAVE